MKQLEIEEPFDEQEQIKHTIFVDERYQPNQEKTSITPDPLPTDDADADEVPTPEEKTPVIHITPDPSPADDADAN